MEHSLLLKKMLSVKAFSHQMYSDMRLFPGSQNYFFSCFFWRWWITKCILKIHEILWIWRKKFWKSNGAYILLWLWRFLQWCRFTSHIALVRSSFSGFHQSFSFLPVLLFFPWALPFSWLEIYTITKPGERQKFLSLIEVYVNISHNFILNVLQHSPLWADSWYISRHASSLCGLAKYMNR